MSRVTFETDRIRYDRELKLAEIDICRVETTGRLWWRHCKFEWFNGRLFLHDDDEQVIRYGPLIRGDTGSHSMNFPASWRDNTGALLPYDVRVAMSQAFAQWREDEREAAAKSEFLSRLRV